MDLEFKLPVQTPVSIELSRGNFKTRYLPPNPNLRMNWRERWKWSKEWKGMVFWATQTLHTKVKPLPWNGKVTVKFIFRVINVMDDDNARASCKAMIDGLTLAKIITDDSQEYITFAGVEQQKVSKKTDQGVDLILIFHKHE